MARKPRIHQPGGVYHVMLRGNGGQDIFSCDEDRYHLYLLIQEGVSRFGHRIHAFCCMSNHLHLVVQVADIPLSKIMQNLSFRYTRWVNRKTQRMGHLFQGRYKAILVDGDSYLLELVRYVHLNPVRAGIVSDPVDYPWSGHRAYLDLEALPWLTTDWVLSQLAADENAAGLRYADFVLAGIGQGRREDFHRGAGDARLLGDDAFSARVLAATQEEVHSIITLDEIMTCVCEYSGLTKERLCSPSRNHSAAHARAVVGWIARETKCSTLTEVAKRIGRDVATLSIAVKKVAVQDEASRLMAGMMLIKNPVDAKRKIIKT